MRSGWKRRVEEASAETRSQEEESPNVETRHRRLGRERGAALVEMALITPLLFLLIAGAIDFGFMINRDTLINNAAREGAREGTLNPSATDVEAVVRSDLADLNQAALTVTVTCRKADNTACATFDADAESGGVVIVNVQYTHGFFTFAPSAVGLGNSMTLGKSVEMRIE
jgi:Flp pilus assembly protein TadG